MSFRAIVLGLLGILVVCGVGYLNDQVLFQTTLVGNHFPIFIYGSLLLVILLLNPILHRIGKNLALTGRELTVVLVMMLTAASIPGSGLMRVFSAALMLPHHFQRTEAAWAKEKVLPMAPPQMLADPSQDEDVALNGFVQGLAVGDESMSPGEVPWTAWTRALLFWVPLLAALWAGLIGLSLVLHRQWADREQLPYPIATFANSLLPQNGEIWNAVFRNRMFWIPAILIMALHLNNYLFVWFPDWVRIPTGFNFQPVLATVPELRAQDTYNLFNLRLYFTVIALAYFVSTEVSLALGLGPFLYLFTLAFFAGNGVALRAGGSFSIEQFFSAGAYLGVLASILYTGRFFYLHATQRAFGLKTREEIPSESIWGMRVFLIGASIFVSLIVSLGVDWQLALLFAALVFTLQVVLGRLLAETGMFFMAAYWIPSSLIVGIFGAKAVGPELVVILGLLGLVLTVDPREALMPFLINNLKLLDLRKFNTGRVQTLCGAGLAVGLAVAIPATLYWQYSKGARMSDSWLANVTREPFNEAVKTSQRLAAQGTVEESKALKSWSRFGAISMETPRLIGLITGFVLVVSFTFARLRFARWPIHPVIFLVMIPWAATQFAFSFMIGWAVKASVTKFGGEQTYQRLKPVMFGVIAGELLGALLPIFWGWFYYWWNDGQLLPKSFLILPS